MFQPDLDVILQKVDCRYTLVVEVAKRARQLVEGAEPLLEQPETNMVSEAVEEVLADKIAYVRK